MSEVKNSKKVNNSQEQFSIDVIAKEAIKKFGATRQIVVAMEELCELSSAIAKFPRYDNKKEAVEKTKEKVLDEYADVTLVMQTIAEVYHISTSELDSHIQAKLARMKRWIDSEEGMEVTTKDRLVQDCANCIHANSGYGSMHCTTCLSSEAVEGVKPFYVERK